MFDTPAQLYARLAELGVKDDFIKILASGELDDKFDEISVGCVQQAICFITDLESTLAVPRPPGNWCLQWSPELLKTAADRCWEGHYKTFMSRRVFNLFVCVAESMVLPGMKEGHYRVPTMQDILDGKSGTPMQDLMMALFEEASERKKNEQPDC